MPSSEEGEINTEALEARVADLERELRATQSELSDALRKLARCERHYAKANKVNEDLRHQMRDLSSELHGYRRASRSRIDVSTQTEIKPSGSHPQDFNVQGTDQLQESSTEQKAGEFDENGMPVWTTGNADNDNQNEAVYSIAEGLKAAAEEALNQSGFIYDENSGLYYDNNSGYYYDAERSLYYEPSCGTYYYYDHGTQTYKIHSQVDMSQYCKEGSQEDQYHRYQKSSHGNKPSKRRQKKDDMETAIPTKRDLDKCSQKPKKKKNSFKEDRPSKRKKKKYKERREEPPDCNCDNSEVQPNEPKSEDWTTEETPKKVIDMFADKDDSAQNTKEVRMEETDLNLANPSPGVLADDSRSNEDVNQTQINQGKKLGDDGGVTDSESEMEEGEVSETTEESASSSSSEEEEEPVAAHYPPCIRGMVKVSDCLDVGTLFLITCTGATIGREKGLNLNVIIPDLNISKMHASITYREDLKKYVVKDHASQNGTSLNGHRLCKPKVMSEEFPLNHGDMLTFGATQIEVHIHPGSETCDSCEPGIVKAAVQAEQNSQKEVVVLSKEEREQQRRQALKMIKRKFGLENAAYVDNKEALSNPAYEDKASERRRTKGSDNPYQPDDAPASVERSIPESNKGHKMLEKMGWKEGQGLGLKEQGRSEPVRVHFRSRASAGLGSGTAVPRSLDDVTSVATSDKWLRAQERFDKLIQGAATALPVPPGEEGEKPTSLWVQGETMDPS